MDDGLINAIPKATVKEIKPASQSSCQNPVLVYGSEIGRSTYAHYIVSIRLKLVARPQVMVFCLRIG